MVMMENNPLDETMVNFRILVIREGTFDFWNNFIIGFSLNGNRVSYVDFNEKVVDSIISHGEKFDLVVANQMGIHALCAAVRDNPGKNWRENFENFLMVQYHDIGRELPTLLQAKKILDSHSIQLHYLLNCKSSADFIEEKNIFQNIIFSHLPISFDYEIAHNAKNSLGNIVDVASVSKKNSDSDESKSVLEFYPKILYIGSYFFDGRIFLSHEGTFVSFEQFMEKFNDYNYERNLPDRFGFINYIDEMGFVNEKVLYNGAVGEYLYDYCCLNILPMRRDYVVFTKNTYNADFHLYGKEWNKFGVFGIPFEKAADNKKYASAFISVDFGSTYLDTSIYQRTMQILSSGGRLLQLRQPDSRDIYEDFSDYVCFNTKEDLKKKIDEALENPLAFIRRQQNFSQFIKENFNEKTVCQAIIRKIYGIL